MQSEDLNVRRLASCALCNVCANHAANKQQADTFVLTFLTIEPYILVKWLAFILFSLPVNTNNGLNTDT